MNAHCSNSEGAEGSNHVQRFRLNPDGTYPEQWYINLPIGSIPSFAALGDKFVEQFASSRSLEKTSDNLYEILRHRAESQRAYIACFNQEKVAIPECNASTAISAFKRDLLPKGDGSIQRTDQVSVKKYGRRTIPSLGAGEMGRRLRQSSQG